MKSKEDLSFQIEKPKTSFLFLSDKGPTLESRNITFPYQHNANWRLYTHPAPHRVQDVLSVILGQ